MTPVEFQSCIDAHNLELTNNMRSNYELSRFNAWLVLSPHMKKEMEPIDLIQFHWEKKEIKKGRVINGKTNSISKVKPTA